MDLKITSESSDLVSLSLGGAVTQRHVTPYEDPFEKVMANKSVARSVLMEMSSVASLDSSGINWLLTLHKKVRESGGRLVLHSLSPIAKNVIRVLSMQSVFALAENVGDAAELAKGAHL